MPKFLARPLGELDQLYDIVGSEVRTDRIDLGAVQLVHAVDQAAREVEITRASLAVAETATRPAVSSLPRFTLQANASNATGGAASLRIAANPHSAMRAGGFPSSDWDVYLTDVAVGIDNSVVTTGELSVSRAAADLPTPGTILAHEVLLRITGASSNIDATTAGRGVIPGFQLSRPIQIYSRENPALGSGFADDQVHLNLNVSNDAIAKMITFFQVCPKNVKPIGF